MRRESRFTRRSINKSKNQLYISLVGIVVVIFVALNFGPALISGLGGVIDVMTGKNSQNAKIINDAGIEHPILDPIPDATPSAEVNISGRSFYNEGDIELVVNGEKYGEVTLDNSQDFIFNNVRLTLGDNYIKVRTVINGKRSDFSEEEKITYIKTSPKLEVSSPQDGQSFSKTDREVLVSGDTDAENNVNINGFIAIVDSSGHFSYSFRLSTGENKLIVTATNSAGHSTSKELTVSYSE